VANRTVNTVSVFNGSSGAFGAWLGDIAVGSYPQGVGVDSTTHKIYVSNRDSGTISVIDGNSGLFGALAGTISGGSVGNHPAGVAVDGTTHRGLRGEHPQRHRVGDRRLERAYGAPLGDITVGAGAWGAGVNTGTHRVYVTNSTDNDVTVIDGSIGTFGTVINTIDVGLLRRESTRTARPTRSTWRTTPTAPSQ